MKNIKQENGRSMVEMLGVLAIIGVLSIGGIAGYTMAMNRYRANEIIDAASKLSVVSQTANNGTGDTTMKLTDIGFSAETLHDATFTVANAGRVVTVKGMSSGVESALKSILGDTTCSSTGGCTVVKEEKTSTSSGS